MVEREVATATTSTVVEQLAAVIIDEGCEHLFTLMGAGNLWMIHHLSTDHGLPVHHLRHENGAIGAADGYARATGKLGWATVTQGPGFTNAITALLTASRGRTPMIMIVSDSSNLDERRFPFAGGIQALAPEVLLDPLGIESVRATGVDAAALLRDAARRARRESKTIVFIMPAGLDKLGTEPLGDDDSTALTGVATGGSGQVSSAEITAAADAVVRAQHPVILVGRGALLADVATDVSALASLIGARVATSIAVLGMMGDDPSAIGPFGGFSVGETEAAIEASDCVISVGSSMNLFQTRKGDFVRGRTVIRLDTSPTPVPDANETVPVSGDLRDTLRPFIEELSRRGMQRRDLEPVPAEAIAEDVSEPGLIDPRVLVREFDRLLPARRRVFVDNGHFSAFPALYLAHHAPRSFVWLPEFGAVGSALAASYAGAVGDDSMPSILFIGDCGLYMTVGDFETIVREQIPLIVVCMNDGAAGSELAHMKDWGVAPDQAIFGYADIAELGRGFGAQAALITDVGDLEPALAGWDSSKGPILLDCHISRRVRSPIYDHT